MLSTLRIRHIGVIDDALLEFGPGFTALTGETGAGKTMIVTGLTIFAGRSPGPRPHPRLQHRRRDPRARRARGARGRDGRARRRGGGRRGARGAPSDPRRPLPRPDRRGPRPDRDPRPAGGHRGHRARPVRPAASARPRRTARGPGPLRGRRDRAGCSSGTARSGASAPPSPSASPSSTPCSPSGSAAAPSSPRRWSGSSRPTPRRGGRRARAEIERLGNAEELRGAAGQAALALVGDDDGPAAGSLLDIAGEALARAARTDGTLVPLTERLDARGSSSPTSPGSSPATPTGSTPHPDASRRPTSASTS
ncbi:AAA family ATPase [Brachybacterium sp. GPGPB12]|uniref:AAA family ATPase n=1 Tax=Brachybacterium sp. GPGPB12 TaxID=3023517 RepID=UPI0031342AA6